MNSYSAKLAPLSHRKRHQDKAKKTTEIHQVDVMKFVNLNPIDLAAKKSNSLPPLPANPLLNKYKPPQRKGRQHGFAPIAMTGTSVLKQAQGIYYQVSPVGPQKVALPPLASKEKLQMPRNVRHKNTYTPSCFNNPVSDLKLAKSASAMREPAVHIASNEKRLTEDELLEYAFLNQAKSINIFSAQDVNKSHEILDLDAQDEQELVIDQAFDVINNYKNCSLPILMEALSSLFSMNFNDLKSMKDLGLISSAVCDILDFNRFSDFEMQKRVLAFQLHLCEDSLFGFGVDFQRVYQSICNYLSRKIKEPELLPPHLQAKKEVKKLLNSFGALNHSLAKNYYLLDGDKIRMFISNYLSFLCLNLKQLSISHLLASSDSSNKLKYIAFPLIEDLKTTDISVLYFFMKNHETRKIVIEDEQCKNSLVEILNALYYIIENVSLNEMATIRVTGQRGKIEDVMVMLIKSFDFYLNVFKYYDMNRIFKLQTIQIRCKLDDVLQSLMKFYYDLFRVKNGLSVLFETLHTVETGAKTPNSSQRVAFSDSGFDLLLESNRAFFGNLKLYEEKTVDFQKISEALLLFLEQVQQTLNSKSLSPDFERFIEAVILIPYNKMAKTIKKNILLSKMEASFEPNTNISYKQTL